MNPFRPWFEQLGSFSKATAQKCNDLFISIQFQGKNYSWRDSNKMTGPPGPLYYPTDFGVCCIFVPHLYFEPFDMNVTLEEMYHNLEGGGIT